MRRDVDLVGQAISCPGVAEQEWRRLLSKVLTAASGGGLTLMIRRRGGFAPGGIVPSVDVSHVIPPALAGC